MPSREGDALILRTYPFREADLIVSFFTRDRGKLRGVAYGVRKPKNRFGTALERLAMAHVHYFLKEGADLAKLRRAELTGPSNLWKANYPTSVILDFIAETADQLLPEREPDDRYFRLLRLVVGEICRDIRLRPGADGAHPRSERALIYFLLWSARLGGWLPPLDRCIRSDRALGPDEAAFFGPQHDGIVCAAFRNGRSRALPPEARTLAGAMLKQRLDKLAESAGDAPAAAALRRFLLQRTQAEVEVRLRGIGPLRALWPE